MTDFSRTKKDIMRSGRAEGPDEAFEIGAAKTEIFLPWHNFGNLDRPAVWDYTEEQILFAEEIAQKVYPVLIQNPTHMKLFRRNVFQVVGLAKSKKDIEPSKFLLCWTPDRCIDAATYKYGETGGTGIAIMVAEMFKVPVYNMSVPDHMQMVLDRLQDHGIKTKRYRKQLVEQKLF